MPKPMWLRGTSASPPCGNWVDQCVRGHGPGWWRTQTRPPKRVKDRPQGPSVSQMLHSFQCLVHTWGIPAPLSLPRVLSSFINHFLRTSILQALRQLQGFSEDGQTQCRGHSGVTGMQALLTLRVETSSRGKESSSSGPWSYPILHVCGEDDNDIRYEKPGSSVPGRGGNCKRASYKTAGPP